jgi:uncharacterized protein (TIGR03086 family)
MSTKEYEYAIAEFRQVLTAVTPDQIGAPTPCASFNVAQLIDHTIGTQRMVTEALRGESFGGAGVEDASDNQAVSYHRAAADAVAVLHLDGALEKTVTLPFGTFSGEHLMRLATLDTFQHAWDLAAATGQDTGLDARLADSLMDVAVAHMVHAPRGDEPAPYGPEQTVPEGAPSADRLAAFLGRAI